MASGTWGAQSSCSLSRKAVPLSYHNLSGPTRSRITGTAHLVGQGAHIGDRARPRVGYRLALEAAECFEVGLGAREKGFLLGDKGVECLEAVISR